ncbi:ABC transporter permease [Granulicella arctica]|uniref:Putative permease n=1 Tax=Granulicella arctica TaxID=940613 RepID=A0A7Y9PF18_9BACT|nr:ABC transporter permease [Granulicella arctica]NYF78725.1 putative permease [Granulicella arctica]
MRTLLNDLSFALRQLNKHRVYAVTAILSMALGIGATAAVYSVLYGVLIDPYPYREANSMAFVNLYDKAGHAQGGISFTMAQVDEVRKAKSVEAVIAERNVDMTSTDAELPQTTKVLQMTGNGFDFLGAPPLLGRTFTSNEAPEGSAPPPVAVISYLFWKSHFASSPAVLGKTLELDHQQYTVIGVVGPRFTWTDAEVYVPLPGSVDPKERMQTLIRLRPEASLATISGEMESLVQQFGRDNPNLLPHDGFRIKVESLNDSLLGEFKGTLFLLFAAVALLLLIGCGNVSILMLARGTARQQELTMRSALGASRFRIVRQLLTESVLISIAGGALGIAIAYLAIHLITGLLPEYSIPHEVVIALNMPVLFFSVAVSVATGIAAGLFPALQFSNPRHSHIAQTGDTRTATSKGSRIRTALIIGQIALTVLLLAGAGAAMRTFLEAHNAHLGFDPHNLLLMDLNLPEHQPNTATWESRVSYYDALTEKLKATPGVTGVSLYIGGTAPRGNWMQPIGIVGTPTTDSTRAGVRLVSEEYLSVMRIPLLRGRFLSHDDVLHGAHVAIVSKTFVNQYLPNIDPIGRLITPKQLSQLPPTALSAPNADQPFQIIGVADDIRNDGLHRPSLPQVYIPSTIVLFDSTGILVRTAADPRQSIHALATSIRSFNANQAVSEIYAYEDFLSEFIWSFDRFISILFSIFSTVALSLAAIGLFSVVAYTVEQRTREIGIRLALGAQRSSVLILALASTVWSTGIGLCIGIALSVGLSDFVFQWTQSSMRNASVLMLISLVFLLASAIASFLPARRATRVDPMIALRAQ